MPEPGSKRARRARPASTTTRTSGMVSEVSAIAVARTSRRPVGERRQRRALLGEGQAAVQRLEHDARRQPRREAGGGAGDLGLAGQEDQRAALGLGERARGRGRRPPPRGAAPARRRRTRAGRASGSRPERRGPRRSAPARRPSAPRPARRRGSPTSPGARRSGRSAARTSSASARPRSACSAALVELVEDHAADARRAPGRDWIIRVRMPSVTTSMRAARRPPRRGCGSRRARPTGSPSASASRSAAARAATRRGSSMRMRARRRRPASSSASGTRVVLPAPGGACSTARPAPASAATERRAGPARSAAPPRRRRAQPRRVEHRLAEVGRRLDALEPAVAAGACGRRARTGTRAGSVSVCASPSMRAKVPAQVSCRRRRPAGSSCEPRDAASRRRRRPWCRRPRAAGASRNSRKPAETGSSVPPCFGRIGRRAARRLDRDLDRRAVLPVDRGLAQRPRRLRGRVEARRHDLAVAGEPCPSPAVEEEVERTCRRCPRYRCGCAAS